MQRSCVLALALGVVSACGRFHFDGARGDGGDDGGGDDGGGGNDGGGTDAGVSATRCVVPTLPQVTNPFMVVGNGTPASCTQTALQGAISFGNVIAFNCGATPITISITNPLQITLATTLVGNHLVTLNGGDASRIMEVNAPGKSVNMVDLAFEHGFAPVTGGAIFVLAGSLRSYGSTFSNNSSGVAANAGGGAVFLSPGGGDVGAYHSVFTSNTAASGGAIMADTIDTVESRFVNNAATGTGGASGTGGLGGAIENTGAGLLNMCGVEMSGNQATELGGAIHRFGQVAATTAVIVDSYLHDNTAGGAGAIFIQNTDTQIRQTSISSNIGTSNNPGVFLVGPERTVIENSSFVNNRTLTGLGVGLSVSGPGTVSFSTFVGNRCTSPICESAAIEGTSALTLTSVAITDNTLTGSGAISCRTQMTDGTASFQWPSEPSSPCAPSVQMIDAKLVVGERIGPAGQFTVATPTATSPVLGAATVCPPVDQLGHARGNPCTAGAIESP